MARVNFETSVYGEIGFQKLVEKSGNRFLAKGWLVELWSLGQEFYKDNRSPISNEAWEQSELPELLITCGFAKRTPSGVEVRGAEKSFAWIMQKVDAGGRGGKASARRERDEKGHFLPKREPSGAQAEEERSQASLLLTPYSSLSSLRTLETKGDSSESALVKNKVGYFIGAYVRAFQARYGEKHRPDLRGKVQGQIKTFLKDIPIERAVNLIQAYCQMDGHRDWFKTKGHDFSTFLENINPISIALERGDNGPGGFDWESFEKKASGSP